MKAAIFPKQIDKKDSVLILGSFESIHNGHKKLIDAAKKYKKPVAMMLIQNPEDIPGHKKPSYATIEQRLQWVAKMGIAKVSVVQFNENIRLLNGKDFVQSIVNATSAVKIVVGQDFGCGKGRSYKAKNVIEDFDGEIVEQQKVNGQKLGTSLLKEMVETGEVDLIKKISPFPFAVSLDVNEDHTFSLENKLKPHPGIYVVDIVVNEMRFWGYAHIGMNDKNKLYLNSFNVKNTIYRANISFHKLSRIIISSKLDKVLDTDIERIESYFNA